MNLIQIPKQKKKQKGFSLIELLISFAILSLGIMAVFILMSKNVEYSRFSKDQILASQLAQEAVELLRNIKDNDTEFNDTVEAGEYIIDKNKFEINTDPDIFKLYLKYEEGNKFYVHEKDDSEPTKFFRRVDLAVKNDTDGKKIIEERIMVSWNDKGLPSDPADCTLANKCLSVGSIAPDTNIVCTCTGVDLVCQGEPVYYDNCEGQCGVGTKTNGECCVPSGGEVYYTNSSGLSPNPSEPYTDGYVVHKITAIGDSTINLCGGGSVDILVVGGGAGGKGIFDGGVGAGGFVEKYGFDIDPGKYEVVVGDGGCGAGNCHASNNPENGKDSIFAKDTSYEIKALGGGVGIGGSGGGGATNLPGFEGTPGQGNSGGFGSMCGIYWAQGGGGGAGENGHNGATDCSNFSDGAGNGGNGKMSTISGEEKWYAGGGAGGCTHAYCKVIGGKGGGGDTVGAYNAAGAWGEEGEDGTGGGAGGATLNRIPHPDGGSGIVIVRYKYEE